MPTRTERLVREPLLQFLAAGVVIFLVYALADKRGGAAGGHDGAAQPAATAPSDAAPVRVIELGAGDIEAVRAKFRVASRREPTPDELGDLVETFVNEEILYREGKALGLDRDDVVVRRRVIEKMTVLARPAAPTSEPSLEELRVWYQRYPHRFAQAPRLSFEQRYFDPKRRADARADARRVLADLPAGRQTRPDGIGAQDDFVLPAALEDRSDLQVAHLYGAAFLAALQAAPLGRWSGPHESSFGHHLVLVTARAAGSLPPFEAVEKQVRADWLTVSTRGVRDAAAALLPRYSVALVGLPPDQAAALAKTSAVAPLLGKRP